MARNQGKGEKKGGREASGNKRINEESVRKVEAEKEVWKTRDQENGEEEMKVEVRE